MYENIFFTSEELSKEKSMQNNLLKTITFSTHRKMTDVELPKAHYEQSSDKYKNLQSIK
jgi:hypothetical protein